MLDREAELVGQTGQRLGAVRQNYPAAGIDHRTLGFEKQVYGFFDLSQVAFEYRVVRTHLDRLGVLELASGGGDIFRNIDDHRTWTAAVGDIKSFLDGDRQLVHVIDQEIVFDARACDPDGVAFLEGVLADVVGRHLSRDDHQRNGIHVGGSNAGNRVGRAWTRGDQGHADLVR